MGLTRVSEARIFSGARLTQVTFVFIHVSTETTLVLGETRSFDVLAYLIPLTTYFHHLLLSTATNTPKSIPLHRPLSLLSSR